VLVLCSGNICRSPIVAGCLRGRLARDGARGIAVDSAGLLGIENAPAAPEAVQVLREAGVDISGHRSRGLSAADLLRADLVVAMTHAHLLELHARFPDWGGERFVLRAFEHGPSADPDAPDLPDPIGEPLRVYRAQLAIVERAVGHLAAYLCARAGSDGG
jgi:protein-tyrosine-phosphatase